MDVTGTPQQPSVPQIVPESYRADARVRKRLAYSRRKVFRFAGPRGERKMGVRAKLQHVRDEVRRGLLQVEIQMPQAIGIDLSCEEWVLLRANIGIHRVHRVEPSGEGSRLKRSHGGEGSPVSC